MAKTPLSIRAPFELVPGSTAEQYAVTAQDEATGKITVRVDGTTPIPGTPPDKPPPDPAARLRLEPVFPGKLTFKPADPASVPDDPSTAGTVRGNLYLELADALKPAFGKQAPKLAYQPILVYFGVELGTAFFTETVLKLLPRKKGALVPIEVDGAKLTTPAQLSRAYAQGKLTVNLAPTAEAVGCVFPALAKDAAGFGTVTLGCGVRSDWDPNGDLKALMNLAEKEIVEAPEWVWIPVAWLYRHLTHLAGWKTMAARGHDAHPFLAAVAATEAPAAGEPPPPVARWRRLRAFPIDLKKRPATPEANTGLENLTLKASAAGGATELWTRRGNLLGELFLRRPDGEAYELRAEGPGGVALELQDEPGKPKAPMLALAWAAPAAGAEPAGEDVGADVPLAGDPLAEPFLALPAGARDRKGITEEPLPKKKPKTLSRHELVRPLKTLLRSLGYGTVAAETTEIDWHTRVALRDFQRDALAGSRTKDGEIVPVTPTFTGTITGEFDEATWTELRVWRDKGYTSPRMLYVDDAGKQTFNVNFCTRHLALGMATLTRYDPLPPGGDDVPDDPLGRVSYYKPQKLYGLMHVYDKNDARKTDYRKWVAVAGRPGALWKKRVVCEVAWNECYAVFESLNSYDVGYLSLGLYHWTLGSGKNEDTGELGAVLADHLSAADFDRLVKPLGLEPDRAKVSDWLGIRSAPLALDGQPLKKELKDEMRSLHWAARVVELSHTAEFQLAQHEAAVARLDRLLALKKVKWGAVSITFEQLLQTEQLRAFALDNHVNNPSTVVRVLQSCVDALRDPTVIASKGTEPPKKGEAPKPAPTTWNTETGKKHTADLQALEAACVAAKTAEIAVTAAGALDAMTAAQAEAFRGIYEFRRRHFGKVVNNDDRWNSILNSNGKSALGAIGTGVRSFPI